MLPVSVCIITKNEATKLKRCLESFSHIPVEIIILDTGSTDNTVSVVNEMKNKKAVAPSFKLYNFSWCHDFSAARNKSIEYASNDYILAIDSDEYLSDTSLSDLKNAIKILDNNTSSVGKIRRINQYCRNGESYENYEWISRFFSKKAFHYEGKIHEQITPAGNNASEQSNQILTAFNLPITFIHDGYDGTESEIRAKAERNITLLKDMLANAKDDPYILYQLGKSYYMIKDFSSAADYLGQALYFDLNPQLDFVIDAVETYGYALLNSGHAHDALALESVYDEFGHTADFKFLMGLIYMNNNEYEKAVNEFLSAVQVKECRMKGTNSYLAYYNAGVIMECTGNTAEAIILYRQCGDYKKAVERLNSLIAL